jgi:hypothetical protein
MEHSAESGGLLRGLVFAYWIVGSLDVGSALLLGDRLPAALAAYQAARSAQPAALGEWFLRAWMIVLLVALIAGTLGILRERRWGRWLFAGANVVMFASYPLLEAMVYTWFGGLFADLSMVLTGAIVALSFYPFRRSP